jgi:hypothetical protein
MYLAMITDEKAVWPIAQPIIARTPLITKTQNNSRGAITQNIMSRFLAKRRNSTLTSFLVLLSPIREYTVLATASNATARKPIQK